MKKKMIILTVVLLFLISLSSCLMVNQTGHGYNYTKVFILIGYIHTRYNYIPDANGNYNTDSRFCWLLDNKCNSQPFGVFPYPGEE